MSIVAGGNWYPINQMLFAGPLFYLPAYFIDEPEPSAQTYSRFWNDALTQFKRDFGNDSATVTRYKMTLGPDRDLTSGWLDVTYETASIQMMVLNQTALRSSVFSHYFVRLDALGFTGDVVRLGEKVVLANGTVYRVASVIPIVAGNTTLFWKCDLEEMPFKETS